MRMLYLFPDTNLFLQCRSLKELPWSKWSGYEEIRLVVCRPVQREIDNRKNQGNDRVGKRARKTHGLFREIVTGKEACGLVREAEPRVKLTVEPEWTPAQESNDPLDYSKTDDEIIGCLKSFVAAHPGVDARLLTHDSGPMATARMVSLSFEPVPDDWLLPPEPTTAERKGNRSVPYGRVRDARNSYPIFGFVGILGPWRARVRRVPRGPCGNVWSSSSRSWSN